MNILTLKGDWAIAKDKLKQRYNQLTDDDLCYQYGREGDLVDRLQQRLGRTRDEIEQTVSRIFQA